MIKEIEKSSKNRWRELLIRLEKDLSRGMVSFIDEDLNLIYKFLYEHKTLISEEKYNLAIKILNACIRKIWSVSDTDILRELFDSNQLCGSEPKSLMEEAFS